MLLFTISLLVQSDPVGNPATPPKPPVAWGAPPAVGVPDKNSELWNFTMRGTGGVVKSVDKDTVTLYRPATEVRYYRHDPVSGALIGLVKTETSPAWAAKTFRLGEELAKGDYIRNVGRDDTYRSTDVRPGDWISVKYDRRDGVDICRTICIERRPGGLIPPAPGEKPEAFRKWHEKRNADQDWEERRIPYPRKYWPTYLGKDGKFYAAPYPQDSIQVIPLPARPVPKG